MTARFEVFPIGSERGELERQPIAEWYWRLRSGNGEIVARSSEGYRDKTDAKRGVEDAAHAVSEAARTTRIDPAAIDIVEVGADAS